MPVEESSRQHGYRAAATSAPTRWPGLARLAVDYDTSATPGLTRDQAIALLDAADADAWPAGSHPRGAAHRHSRAGRGPGQTVRRPPRRARARPEHSFVRAVGLTCRLTACNGGQQAPEWRTSPARNGQQHAALVPEIHVLSDAIAPGASLTPSKPSPAARYCAGRGDGGAQACRQGRDPGPCSAAGGPAGPARGRRHGLPGCLGGRGRLLGVQQQCPDERVSRVLQSLA